MDFKEKIDQLGIEDLSATASISAAISALVNVLEDKGVIKAEEFVEEYLSILESKKEEQIK